MTPISLRHYASQLLALLLTVPLLSSCGPSSAAQAKTKATRLMVAASAKPHAELLEQVQAELKAEGYELTILVMDDYNLPNRALDQREIQANFFQHEPFLKDQIEAFHYKLVSIAHIEIEPMGLYSHRLSQLDQLPSGATIALPNDPSNEARALLLLEAQGLITLKEKASLQATPAHISSNPKQLKFLEIDASMLARTLEDVDLTVLNANYAIQAGLTPSKDALALESASSRYANILVIHQGDEKLPEILALKKALTSETMRQYILKQYKGALIPAF